MVRMTEAAATAAGYTVDHCTYPHVGYKGRRFQPTEHVYVLTELEEQMLAALKRVPIVRRGEGYCPQANSGHMECIGCGSKTCTLDVPVCGDEDCKPDCWVMALEAAIAAATGGEREG